MARLKSRPFTRSYCDVMPGDGFAVFVLGEKALQLDLDHARVHSFEDGDDALEHHLFVDALLLDAEFAACRRRAGRMRLAAPTP